VVINKWADGIFNMGLKVVIVQNEIDYIFKASL